MKYLVLLGALLFSLSTLASGQCEIVSSDQALLAHAVLNSKLSSQEIFVVDQFCESCMDELPKPIVVSTIEQKVLNSKTLSQILINGKAVDMAYIYVDGENLAAKIGCKTIAVSHNLD